MPASLLGKNLIVHIPAYILTQTKGENMQKDREQKITDKKNTLEFALTNWFYYLGKTVL